MQVTTRHVSSKPKKDTRPPIRLVWTPEGAEQLCRELFDQPIVSVDSEWYAYDKNRTPVNNGLAACWTFAWWREDGQMERVYLHNYGEGSQSNVYALTNWWKSDRHRKIAHNAPVDWHILANHGIIGRSFDHDTMVADHLYDERREDAHGLKECVNDHFGKHRVSYAETFGTVKKKRDGTPYASGQRDVPRMEEIAGNLDVWQTILVEYSVEDAEDALDLNTFYERQLRLRPWVNGKSMWDYFLEKERPITNLLQRMERKGMYLDLRFLREMAEVAKDDLDRLETMATEWAGCPMNIGSGPQLAKLLYGKGPQPIHKGSSKKVLFTIQGRGWPILRTTEKGAPSTKAEHLVELRNHLVRTKVAPKNELDGFDHILTFKKYEKQRNTYLVGLQEAAINSRVHGRINQIGTTSGRFSSSEPNLQNITTGDKDVYHIRDCFRSPPGKLLIVADFSQLEYRLLAHFSQEPKLIRLFHEGWDLHSLTAYNIYPHIKREVDERFGGLTAEGLKWLAEPYSDDRKRAKTLNFEIIYGVGNKKLADQLRITDKAAQDMIDGWFRGYPYVKAWMNNVLNTFRQQGYYRTLVGRYRHADKKRLLNEQRWIRGEEERTLLNSIIQGSAADMAKQAMINLDNSGELRDLGYEQNMQVHDEIIGECPISNCGRAVEVIRPLMEQPFTRPLRIPMPVTIGIGPTWSTAKA